MNKNVQLHNLTNENTPSSRSNAHPTPPQTPSSTASRSQQDHFNEKLAEELFEGENLTARILPFKSPSKAHGREEHHKTLTVVCSSSRIVCYLVFRVGTSHRMIHPFLAVIPSQP